MYKKYHINHLVYLTLIFIFINSYETTDIVYKLSDIKNWTQISEGWPRFDQNNKDAYNESTQFFYRKGVKTQSVWKFNGSIVEDGKMYKLSFKYWNYYKKGSKIQTQFQVEGIEHMENIDDRYWSSSGSYVGYWMPVEYILSGEQLKKLSVTIDTADESSLAAFKDFKLEYESTENNNNDLDNSLISFDIENSNFHIETFDTTNVNINERHCFQIDYMNSEDIQLNVVMKLNEDKEEKGQTIFTFKPKITDIPEQVEFCLDSLILLIAEKFNISFNVKHYQYMTNFYFAVTKTSHLTSYSTAEKKVEKTNFLNSMELNKKNEWQNQWTHDSAITSGKQFTFKDDHVQFLASTTSQNTASAHLISDVWVKYDSALNSVDSKFTIKVEDPAMFNSFRIRPQVCDWLFHCEDVIQTNQIDKPEKVPKERTITFKIKEIKNSEYFKLQFYIEYLKPIHINDEESHTIKFQIKLDHFGDACSQSSKINKCEHGGICRSDPKFDKPNEHRCECKLGEFTGPYCNLKDHCNIFDKEHNIESGRKQCFKANKAICENLQDGFRCLCGVSPSTLSDYIFWNPDKKKCEELGLPTTKGWQLDGKKPQYVNDKDNSLVYHFENINTEKFNVCLTLRYKSESTVSLSANYKVGDNYVFRLFDVYLKTTKDSLFDFCLKDFIYSLNEKFDIEFKITFDEYKEKGFSLVDEQIIARIDYKEINELDFIENWVHNDKYIENSKLNVKSNWISIPDNSVTKNPDQTKEIIYEIELNKDSEESNEKIDYLFISDWIKYNPSFDGKTYTFKVKFLKGYFSEFALFSNIIYQDSENKMSFGKEWNEAKNNNKDSEECSGEFEIPNNVKNVFKLVFKIHKPIMGEHKGKFNLEFRELSLGDPCNDKSCNYEKSTCYRKGANDYECRCDNSTLLGNDCNSVNSCEKENENGLKYEEFCKTFPNGKCDSHSDQCICDQSYYEWINGRCVQKINYYSHQKTCEGKTCNFFDKIYSDTKWWDKKMPKIDANKSIVPFYYTTQSDSQIVIQFNNYNNEREYDYCLNITYQLSNSNSGLQISYEKNSPIELNTYLGNNEEWIEDKICVNTLDREFIAENFSIILKPRLNSVGTDSISVILEDRVIREERDKNIKNTFEYLSDHIDKNDPEYKQYEQKNQWPIALPSNALPGIVWTIGNSQIELQTYYPGQQTATLISNWIKNHNDIHEYKLRFLISDYQITDYNINFEIFDDKMSSKLMNGKNTTVVGNKNIKKNKEFVSIPLSIPSDTNFFRVSIKVTYNSNKLSNEKILSIDSFDLGDPCVDDNGKLNTCHDNGKCLRKKAVTEKTCDCDKEYLPEYDCSRMNYCNSSIKGEPGKRTGEELCQNLKIGHCHLGRIDDFYCDCEPKPNTYWVSEKKDCVPFPKCAGENDYDPNTSICNENNGNPTFECKKGYIDLENKFNRTKCLTKYDVCDEKHRKHLEQNTEKPCSDTNSYCVATFASSDPQDKNDYLCVCKEGFKKSGSGTKTDPKCTPNLCDMPSTNKCQQKCINDKDSNGGYRCECFNKELYEVDANGKCNLNKDKTCKCAEPFFCGDNEEQCFCKGPNDEKMPVIKDKDGKDVCDPEHITAPIVCPDGKIKVENNELVCDCGHKYNKSDNHLCSFKSICGEGSDGKKDCDQRNKLCFIDPSNFDGYSCGGPNPKNSSNKEWCPDGMSDNSGFCVDKCSPRHQEDCARVNAFCNPIKGGKSFPDYCECRPGFIQKESGSSFKCIIGKYSVTFNLKIQNSFFNEIEENNELIESQTLLESNFANIKGFYTAIKESHEINLKRLKEYKQKSLQSKKRDKILVFVKILISKTNNYFNFVDTLRIVKCTEDTMLDCQFTLTLDKKISSFGKDLSVELKDLSIVTDKNLYFFDFSNSITYDTTSNIMFVDKSGLDHKPTTYKTCMETSKEQYTNCEVNSNCVDSPDKESSLYKCICNPDFFDTMGFDPIDYNNGQHSNETIQEHCYIKKEEELCTLHCNTMDQCINSKLSELVFEENTSKYTVHIDCDCNTDKKLVTVTGNKQCVDACSDVNCHNGHCIHKKDHPHSFACVCDEKYTGEHCDEKLNEGGWIAAVVVLAVLVVVAAGIAFFFARRKRNLGNSPSTRQLDDFPDNTSYRVRQSGGVV